MSAIGPEEFAQLIYSRLPGQYRARDAEQNLPLLALLRVIGAQASNLRQNLDDLWDNFFIETCDDWVVPYLGKLLGTRLLANPVGQSDRLDVWNTVAWRRSKGTPRMLQALSTAITGWPTDFAEFFQQLGWSQNLNHLRSTALLTPNLRDLYTLSRLGRADDMLLHAADFKPAQDLDQPRTTMSSLSIGKYAWGTPGRYAIKNVGFFVRRLQTFPIAGGTPAAVAPGEPSPANAFCFTFNPLYREVPLFSRQSAATISRADFAHAPWNYFGTDIAVRQYGVLLASSSQPQPTYSNSSSPFTFGGQGAGITLHPLDGLRLMEPETFQSSGISFVITARWQQHNGEILDLGAINTAQESLNLASAFKIGATSTDTGVLLLSIQMVGPGTPQWALAPFSGLHPGRFPGAVVALRAAQVGALRNSDGLYAYLPAAYLAPGAILTLSVGDDGSTYYDASLSILSSAREAGGQVYPQWGATPSALPAINFTALHRRSHGLVLADPSRFAGTGVLFTAELYTGTPQTLGSIATINQVGADYPHLKVPAVWSAFTFGADPQAVTGDEVHGLLDILVKPLAVAPAPLPTRIPPIELVFNNRAGEALLIYLPEINNIPAAGVRFFVADDGSSYYFPASEIDANNALNQESFAGLVLARAAAGQVLAIPGVWPLRQRSAVALNLCRCERVGLLNNGEIGIDPERGRFGFAPNDPLMGATALSVDYVEAFSDRTGAVNFNREIDPALLATRIIASSGDADVTNAAPNARIYTTLAAALAESQDGDILEFADSATYNDAVPSVLSNPAIENLTIRARAGQRPCLAYYTSVGAPTSASLLVLSALHSLSLNGLLFSGGPITIHSAIENLQFVACTLDPTSATGVSLYSESTDSAVACTILLCRCITGALRLGNPSLAITIADSILDAYQGVAIANATPLTSPPIVLLPVPADATVQLERVTVLGRIYCDVLSASESLLDDLVFVEDQQAGCVRFCRYESGSVLPRRFQCVPTEYQIAAANPLRRVLPPLFNSRRYGRPTYMQLASACPAEILTASASAAEVGAFASALNTIRLSNLAVKLQEFMPVGLTPVIIAET